MELFVLYRRPHVYASRVPGGAGRGSQQVYAARVPGAAGRGKARKLVGGVSKEPKGLYARDMERLNHNTN
ncbi:predicted protein [Arabidopsis lyrata subsp. lyrata]|uniref:Predicted protein n=1 Tax=Arabidopsis lyrata subsp. lyrata TaxID=81972 RepID=D7MHX8_ARALL|nr:predicted protein [Arabidopsis lyrata subsp. lyrata]